MIGDKIKKRREELNLTQEYVADSLGISQPAYVKIEKGWTKIDVNRLLKISDLLSVELGDLLERNLIINELNNKDYSTAIGYVENLHQGSETLKNSLIKQILELKEENKKLLLIIENLTKK